MGRRAKTQRTAWSRLPTEYEFRTMQILRIEPGITRYQVAKLMNTSSGSSRVLLNRMVEKGLVQKVRAERVMFRYELTTAGTMVSDRLAQLVVALEDAVEKAAL